MYTKKLLLSSIVLLSFVANFANAAYIELDCGVDPVFSENSCNQCFEGGTQAVGSNIGLLSDLWINSGENSQILYKEEQNNPSMIPLNGAVWNQIPSSDGFWEYPASMEALYNETEGGYILASDQSVDWIQSKIGYAYNLAENTSLEGENIGLLTYPIVTHEISENGSVEINGDSYKECVLFKSAVPTEEPKELPETGPENMLLLLLAMLLGLGLIKITRRA